MSSYVYRFTVQDVEFAAEYMPGAGWIVRHGTRYVPAGKKSSSLIKKRVVSFIIDTIAREKCGGDRECVQQTRETMSEVEVLEVIRREVLSKVQIRRRAYSVSKNVDRIIAPVWFTADESHSIAAAMVYEVQQQENEETIIEPYLLLAITDPSGDTRLEKIRLVDVLVSGVEVGGKLYLVHAPAFEVGDDEETDVIDLEKRVRRVMKDALTQNYISFPDLKRTLEWWGRVRRDPMAWLRWVVEVVGDWLRERLWRSYGAKYVRLFLMRHVAYLFAYVYDFLPHTVFRGPPGSGKSYHVGLLTFLVPYGILYTASTRAAVDRIRTFAAVVGIQEVDSERRDIIELLIRAFDKYGTRAIANGPTAKIFSGGVALILADVGNLRILDESGAAATRMMEHYQRVDPRMRKMRHPYSYIVEEFRWRGKTPDGDEVELRAEDLWALETAVFLAAAHKVYEVYREVAKRVESEGWRGIDVLPRTLQIHMPLIVVAEILGQEYVETLKEWLARQPKEPNYELGLFAMVLAYIIENYNKEPLRGKVRVLVGREEENGDTPALLVPMSAIVEAAALATQVSLESTTVRQKYDPEGLFQMVDVWRRGRVPRNLSDERVLIDWVRTRSEVGRRVLVLAKNQYGHYRYHMFVTPRVVELMFAEARHDYPEESEICDAVRPHLEMLLTVVDQRSAVSLRECGQGDGGLAQSGNSQPPSSGGETVECESRGDLSPVQDATCRQSSEDLSLVKADTPSSVRHVSSAEGGNMEQKILENGDSEIVYQAEEDGVKIEVYKAKKVLERL